jgi:hypothetical protein
MITPNYYLFAINNNHPQYEEIKRFIKDRSPTYLSIDNNYFVLDPSLLKTITNKFQLNLGKDLPDVVEVYRNNRS